MDKFSNIDTDWFDGLNHQQQQDILEGLVQADKGETVPHADVVKIFAHWGLK
jgi:predicted transcriptional regulator